MGESSVILSANLLIVLTGALTIAIGAFIVPSTHIYILQLYGLTLRIPQRSFSFFTIFDGFFLIVFGYSLTGKTRTSWKINFASLIVTVFVLILSSTRRDHITLLGIALSLFSIYILLKRRFQYRYPSRTIGRPEIAVAIITIIFTVSYGVGGSLLFGNEFNPPITNLGTAIYYTGETVTTLGFGDILPVTLASRMFTISLSILGVAIFFGAMTILITPIIERRIGGIVNRMEKHQLESLENYTLCLGYSEYILGYLKALESKGDVVVVVEKDEKIAERLKSDDFIVLNQSADDESLLLSFNLEKSKQILISSPDDGYNLLICSALNQVENERYKSIHSHVTVIAACSTNIKKFKIFQYHVVDISSIIGEFLMSNR